MSNDDARDVLIRRATFGKQVETFLVSDIGRYMLARADHAIVMAFNELKHCDPKDGKLVQQWQNQIWRAESIKDWLGDAVADGLTAIGIIDSPD